MSGKPLVKHRIMLVLLCILLSAVRVETEFNTRLIANTSEQNEKIWHRDPMNYLTSLLSEIEPFFHPFIVPQIICGCRPAGGHLPTAMRTAASVTELSGADQRWGNQQLLNTYNIKVVKQQQQQQQQVIITKYYILMNTIISISYFKLRLIHYPNTFFGGDSSYERYEMGASFQIIGCNRYLVAGHRFHILRMILQKADTTPLLVYDSMNQNATNDKRTVRDLSDPIAPSERSGSSFGYHSLTPSSLLFSSLLLRTAGQQNKNNQKQSKTNIFLLIVMRSSVKEEEIDPGRYSQTGDVRGRSLYEDWTFIIIYIFFDLFFQLLYPKSSIHHSSFFVCCASLI
eukprot:gene2280-1422_t